MSPDVAPAGLRLDIEDRPAAADVEVLPNGLEAFNESRWPGHQQWKPLAVFAREGEAIVAGLAGEAYSGWLFIKYLWGLRGAEGQGDRTRADGGGRGPGDRARLPLILGRHLLLPGAGLLSEAWLRAVRRTRLAARLGFATIRRHTRSSSNHNGLDPPSVHRHTRL
jgi:hypothetical protein